MNKVTVSFNIKSLLYNNDIEAIEVLKQLKLYSKYASYDKDIIERVVNTIKLTINDDDTIDYIKKKLSLELFQKLKVSKTINKTCFYCFSDKNIKTHKTNEIIKVEDKTTIVEEDLFTEFKTKKKEDIEEDSDDEFNLDDLSDMSDDESLASIDISELLQDGGAKKTKNIMVCHNCKKIYFFKNHFDINNFEKYDDIFPLPDLFYFWNDTNKIGYKLIDNNQNDLIDIGIQESFNSPFSNIKDINRKKLLKGKNNKLITYLNLVATNDIRYHKYIKNESYLIYNNYEIQNNTINLSYLPELALYVKSNETKCLDLYAKIYWPYINFANYYLKFIRKNMNYEYLSCLNSKVNRKFNKYKVEDLIIEGGWGDKTETSDKLINHFEKLDEIKEYEEYTNKIFYKINDTNNLNTLINFQNIYHLFQLDETVPYLSSYIPEESIILEKIYKPLKDELSNKDWQLYNKNIVHFRVLFPQAILNVEEKYYIQVNLYENLKIEVSIPIPAIMKQFITKEHLLLINDTINNLIKRLNVTNIFNFEDLQIPLSETNFENWNKKTTKINSMNISLKLKLKINELNMIKYLNNLNSCMGVYFHKDFDFVDNNFRYKRINNVKISDIFDRFIYHTNNAIIEEFNIDNEKEIKVIIIKRIETQFHKSLEESISIYENYKMRFKSFMIKPLNYGLYFNIKEPDEWKDIESDSYNYKVTVMGMRDFNDWDKVKGFILKLFSLIEGVSQNDKKVLEIKKICNLDNIDKQKKLIIKKSTYINYQQEKFQCNINSNELEQDIKNETNITVRKQLQAQKRLINTRMKTLKTLITDKKRQMKTASMKNIVSYLSRLQDIYPNLKLQCDKCGSHASSKDCVSCGTEMNISMYSKQCQKKRQPMGTGSGTAPQIIEFNKETEIQRFNELNNITCNVGQKGGTIEEEKIEEPQEGEVEKKYTTEIYEKWGSINNKKLYPKKMKIKNCMNTASSIMTQGYKKTDIKQIGLLYDIQTDKMKKSQVCKAILEKIKKSSGELKMTDKILNKLNKHLIIEKENKNQSNIEKLKYLIEYYKRKTQKYNLNNDVEINKLIKDLNIKIKLTEPYKIKIDTILTELLKIFKNNFNILQEKYISLFDLKTTFKKIINSSLINKEKDQLIKMIIFYNIYTLVNKWKENHIKIIYTKLTDDSTIAKNKKDLVKKIDHIFNTFMNKHLMFNGMREMIETDSFNKTSENDFSAFVSDTGLIVRKDRNNNIVQSTMSFKGSAISCPNYDDNDNNALVGFLDMSNFDNKNKFDDKKIRNMFCQPCCFTSKKDENKKQVLKPNYARNMLFCKGKISWDGYLKKIEEEEKTENYISTTTSSNKNNTYGKLPPLLHDLFNNYIKLYNIRTNKTESDFLFTKFKNNLLKSAGFVLQGIRQVNNTILLLLSEVLNISIPDMISNIESKLKSNELIFKTLNDGKIYIKFKTIKKYIEYLKGEVIDIRWIIDIVSIPNLFENYKEGLNIIIFTETYNDIQIKDYTDIIYEDYYSKEKSHVFIYENEIGEIEPILLKYPGKMQQEKVFRLKSSKKMISHFKKNNISEIFSNFYDFIEEWIVNIFITQRITNKKMINILSKTEGYNIKHQLVDNFNKSNYIVTKNNEMIPILPSKFDVNVPTKFMDIQKLPMKSIEDTLDYISNFALKIDNEEYNFAKLILDSTNKNVVGIELHNQLIIPTIKQKYEKSSFKKMIISKNKLFFEINNALFKEEIPEIDEDFIKESYDFEIHQRLILEFANFLNMNNEYKELLENLTANNTFENKAEIKKIVINIIEKISVFKEPETINLKEFLKYNNKNNIRKLCRTEHDILCEKDSDNIYKIIIPLDKKNRFIGILIETLVSNDLMRVKILTNKINKIIDVTLFLDDDKHIFLKRDAIFQ